MNIGKSKREVNRLYLWMSSIPLYGLPAFLDPDPAFLDPDPDSKLTCNC